MGGVTVQKGQEGHRVYDTFVKDQAIAFDSRCYFESFCGWVAGEKVGIHHVNIASLVIVQRLANFVQVCAEVDGTDVDEGIGDHGEQRGGCRDRHGCGFLRSFPKFAPEGIQHQFGSGFASGVLLDHVRIGPYPFTGCVTLDVLGLLPFTPDPTWVPSGLSFDFQPLIDVVGEKSRASLVFREVPDLVDVYEGVPHLDGFH